MARPPQAAGQSAAHPDSKPRNTAATIAYHQAISSWDSAADRPATAELIDAIAQYATTPDGLRQIVRSAIAGGAGGPYVARLMASAALVGRRRQATAILNQLVDQYTSPDPAADGSADPGVPGQLRRAIGLRIGRGELPGPGVRADIERQAADTVWGAEQAGTAEHAIRRDIASDIPTLRAYTVEAAAADQQLLEGLPGHIRRAVKEHLVLLRDARAADDVLTTAAHAGQMHTARAQLSAADHLAVVSAAQLAALDQRPGTTARTVTHPGFRADRATLSSVHSVPVRSGSMVNATLTGSHSWAITHTNLAGATITGLHDGCTWEHINLTGAVFDHCFLSHSTIHGHAHTLTADGLQITNSTVTLTVDELNMHGASINGGTVTVFGGTTSFADAAFRATNLTITGGCDFTGADLTATTLAGVFDRGTCLAGTVLVGCEIRADFTAVDPDMLRAAEFRQCRVARQARWPQGFTPPRTDRSW